ncbi:MAG: hypothetical protein GY792_03080, partial [Gammaproteobacteria bacterium]|nr:hypothetical protein [Gammaproteobacteria bacterium]
MDELLKKYAKNTMSLEEKARLGILPDQLRFSEIIDLWVRRIRKDDDITTKRQLREKRRNLDVALSGARKAGVLKVSKKTITNTLYEPISSDDPWRNRFERATISDQWQNRDFGGSTRRPSRRMKRSTGTKETTVYSVHQDDFRAWLISEGEEVTDIPEGLRLWAGWSKGDSSQNHSDVSDPTEPPREKKRRSTIAIEKAREALLGTLKQEPSCDEVINYLRHHDTTRYIVDYNDGVIKWVDRNNKEHELTHKAIA